jgi:hypothetical protein
MTFNETISQLETNGARVGERSIQAAVDDALGRMTYNSVTILGVLLPNGDSGSLRLELDCNGYLHFVYRDKWGSGQ